MFSQARNLSTGFKFYGVLHSVGDTISGDSFALSFIIRKEC